MKKTIAIIGLIIFLTVSVFASCQGLQQSTPLPEEPPQDDNITSKANIESVEVALLESFPVQVQVIAKGYLEDSCTEIAEIQKQQIDNTFEITITTKKPADAICAQVIKLFEENISLEAEGLKKGTYTVNVNGKTEEFTLETDNVSPQN